MLERQKLKDLKLGEKGALISIFAYLCLSLIKLIVGYTAHSEALRADGFNNVTDIVASAAILIGLRFSQKPPDKDHPYGHWKAETVASMAASFIMMMIGLQVLYQAFYAVFEAKRDSPDLISAWVGLFCAFIMYFVYRYNKKLAHKINSQAILAAAKDNLSDTWVSIGAVVGIIGAQFGLPWLDPLAALLVGLLICKTAWSIFHPAFHHLTDGFDEEKLALYKKAIVSIQGVMGVKDIRARSYGNNTVVDIILLVHPSLDIQEAHDISTKVESELIEAYDVYDVHVHIEPKT